MKPHLIPCLPHEMIASVSDLETSSYLENEVQAPIKRPKYSAMLFKEIDHAGPHSGWKQEI